MEIKLYEILFQCAICNETTAHFLTNEKWVVGDKSHAAICPRCSEDDTAIVTYIDMDVILDSPEQIREHLEETKANTEQVDHLLRDRLPDEIESLTAWVIPQSRYPERDWLTTKEAADEAGLPKSTVQTWIDRGKLFEAQIRGLIQKTSSITLIHRSVVGQLKKMK